MKADKLPADGKRTDFYEFYWADIMQGTTGQHIMSWIRGLLVRAPHRVPGNVFAPWLFLWLLIGISLFYVMTLIARLGFLIAGGTLPVSYCVEGAPYIDPYLIVPLGGWFACFGERAMLYLFGLAIAGLVVVVARWFLRRPISVIKSLLAALVFLMIGVVFFRPIYTFVSAIGIGTVLLPLLAVGVHRFLVNYFGDVARYVEAAPANVEKRQAVRERGLALLRELHDCGDYGRIIVVAHSLGSIVAYDLLKMLWAERGPQPSNPLSAAAGREIAQMDEALASLLTGRVDDFDPGRFRNQQRKISNELAKIPKSAKAGRKPWLVSDFVTMGSPLTHAEFLLARDEQGVKDLIAERQLPVAPPVLERDRADHDYSFRYKSGGKLYPHHASLFCAVRWTNIFDNHWFPLCGDVISGSLKEWFGRGVVYLTSGVEERIVAVPAIREHRVAIQRRHLGGRLRSRIFTHTEYWTGSSDPADGDVDHHIAVLREAVNLRDRPDAEREEARS